MSLEIPGDLGGSFAKGTGGSHGWGNFGGEEAFGCNFEGPKGVRSWDGRGQRQVNRERFKLPGGT